jgi:coenzyme F420-reducing hydrogenase gamma subunit
VDFELRGCPINKHQLLEVLSAYLNGRRPNIPAYSLCLECKRAGITCVAVAQGLGCLGPVTHAGCGALCPGYQRACFGCFGPKETPNTSSLSRWWNSQLNLTQTDIVRAFRGFNAYADAFRKESEFHEEQ